MKTRALSLAQGRLEAKRSVRWEAMLQDDLDHDGRTDVVMADDGQGADVSEEDGIYTGQWEHDGISLTWTVVMDRLADLDAWQQCAGPARDGEAIFTGLALNDVVVSRGATASMVELKVDVGDEFVANMRADGVIVASPTGSTAYSLSSGGPILHPSIAGWVLVPIASHALSNRPIVLPDRGEVSLEIVAGRDASVNFDMQSLASLLHGDRITVRRSAHKVSFLHPKGWSYYGTLRRKLRWHEGVV